MTRKKKTTVAVMLLFCVIIGTLVFLRRNRSSHSEKMALLNVTVLKVGKADTIVIQSEGHAMIIDTGEEDDGAELVAFLESQGIHRVDALVITHFDRDHVGGADTLVKAMEIGQVFLPAYQGDSTDYLEFMEALKLKRLIPQEVIQPFEFTFMAASVLIEPPVSYETDGDSGASDNNFSLITTVVHGNNRFLFMGDAEKQRIRQWVSGGTATACNFLKMPHHGVYSTALEELLAHVAPQYAVICSSRKHPADEETLELLKRQNIFEFETKNGDVTAISDGSHLDVQQAVENEWRVN